MRDLAPELALVIPTLNERDNVQPLLDKLNAALQDIHWEAIFVDDNSRDGTAELIREVSGRIPHVRVLQRVGRRGLTSACIEGIMATAAKYVAIMDADLQHDETLLPRMLDVLRSRQYDLVIASRNTGDGSMGNFSTVRVRLSHAGKWLSQTVAGAKLSDPMSGFFMADTEFVREAVPRMSAISFKVLVDLVSSSGRQVRFAEVPYTFRERIHGESKLDPNTLLEYGILIAHKLIRGVVPVRFVLFSIVGTVGLVLHLLTLGIAVGLYRQPFQRWQLIGTLIAMFSNFWLNNEFTFRDRRLKGAQIFSGALTFALCCGLGAISSIALGDWLIDRNIPLYLAGAAGTIMAAVWNFGVSSMITWPERKYTLR